MIIRSLSFSTMICCGFIALSALCGCATADRKIGLDYVPADRSFGHHSGEITVSRVDAHKVTKNSTEEWIIGSLNNIHGVHQADLLGDRSPGEWITEAILLELKHAGYTASYSTSIPSSTTRGILISDIHTVLQINQGLVSSDVKQELRFNVDIYVNGFKTKTITVASRDSKTLPLTVSKEEQEQIMLMSLQDAVKLIIPEIIALSNRQ